MIRLLPLVLILGLASAACAPQLRRDAAAALDSARRLHTAGCIEAPLLPAKFCADELRNLVDLEPRIEGAQRRSLDYLRQILALAKPHAIQALRQILDSLQLPYPASALVPLITSYLEAFDL